MRSNACPGVLVSAVFVSGLGLGQAQTCIPKTFFCNSEPIEVRAGGKTLALSACGNTTFMGELARYFQDGLGWQQAKDPARATVIMDSGLGYMVSGEGSAGACKRRGGQLKPIVGAFLFPLEVLKKASLPFLLCKAFGLLKARLAGGSLETSCDVDAMYEHWGFLPKTYDVADTNQRQQLLSKIPLSGLNEDWLVKTGEHGGRGILTPKTYEELRTSVEVFVKKYEAGDEQQASFQIGGNGYEAIRQKHAPNCIVQNVVQSLDWEGQNFVVRFVFAALRTGETKPPPARNRQTSAIEEPWLMGDGRYELFVFEAPYFMRHAGVVSDSAEKSVFDCPAFEAYLVQLNASHHGFCNRRLLPEVERISRIVWAASEKQAHQIEYSAIEPDGSYSIFAGDFLITPLLEVILLEFSTGISTRHAVRQFQMFQVLLEQTADLFLSQLGDRDGERDTCQSGSGTACRGIHEGAFHWRKIAERHLLPHP